MEKIRPESVCPFKPNDATYRHKYTGQTHKTLFCVAAEIDFLDNRRAIFCLAKSSKALIR